MYFSPLPHRSKWHLRLGSFLAFIGLVLAATLFSAQPASAACTALPTNNGTATFTVNIPSSGTYRFWAHLYSPSTNNNGVYLQVDETYCQLKVGDTNAIPTGKFTWVDYQNGSTSNKLNVSLTSGNHTVKMAGLDPGVGIDKVMFLADTSCTPTGDGGNCVAVASTPVPSATPVPSGAVTPKPSPTTIFTPAPGKTPTPGGVTPVSGVISLPKPTQADATRTYYLNDQPIVGDELDTTQLANGEHTLKIVERDANGETKTVSQTINVNNDKSLKGKVLAWISRPLNIGIVLAVLVLLVGGVYALWRIKLIRFPHRSAPVAPTEPTAAVPTTTVPATPTTSDEPPAPPVVYPDNSDKPDSRL